MGRSLAATVGQIPFRENICHMDILHQIIEKTLTIKKAQAILDNAIEEGIDWILAVGFDKYEATAYAHGAGIKSLSIMRRDGWPTLCSKCHQPINYRKFYWWFQPSKDGKPAIHHIDCTKPSQLDNKIR